MIFIMLFLLCFLAMKASVYDLAVFWN